MTSPSEIEDAAEDDSEFTVAAPRWRGRPTTIRARLAAIETTLGVAFVCIVIACVTLLGVLQLAQAVYLVGRERGGALTASLIGVGLLTIAALHVRTYFMLHDAVERAGDDPQSPLTWAACVRRGGLLWRFALAIWSLVLAVALLVFSHAWSALFEHPRGDPNWIVNAIAYFIAAALLFVGTFAANGSLVLGMAAVGVGDGVIAWYWRWRYVWDVIIAVVMVAVGIEWTDGLAQRIFPLR